jgi:hypothetical protein
LRRQPLEPDAVALQLFSGVSPTGIAAAGFEP